MISGFTLTILVVRSTSAPCASQISRARSDGNRTPTFSMIQRVAAWIFRTSAGVRISSLSLGLVIDLMFLGIPDSLQGPATSRRLAVCNDAVNGLLARTIELRAAA